MRRFKTQSRLGCQLLLLKFLEYVLQIPLTLIEKCLAIEILLGREHVSSCHHTVNKGRRRAQNRCQSLDITYISKVHDGFGAVGQRQRKLYVQMMLLFHASWRRSLRTSFAGKDSIKVCDFSPSASSCQDSSMLESANISAARIRFRG